MIKDVKKRVQLKNLKVGSFYESSSGTLVKCVKQLENKSVVQTMGATAAEVTINHVDDGKIAYSLWPTTKSKEECEKLDKKVEEHCLSKRMKKAKKEASSDAENKELEKKVYDYVTKNMVTLPEVEKKFGLKKARHFAYWMRYAAKRMKDGVKKDGKQFQILKDPRGCDDYQP